MLLQRQFIKWHYGGCLIYNKRPPKRNDRTTKPKRRADKGVAAEQAIPIHFSLLLIHFKIGKVVRACRFLAQYRVAAHSRRALRGRAARRNIFIFVHKYRFLFRDIRFSALFVALLTPIIHHEKRTPYSVRFVWWAIQGSNL